MNRFFLFLSFLFVLGTAHAQAPQGIPYQAAARNSSGAVLASTTISVRFTIRDSVPTGIIKYRETHSTTTNANGMFSVNVGQGTPVSGTFASINWGTNAKFMQVELDPAGGSSYIDMGTQQMMSVPYALNASAIKHNVSTTGDTLFSGGGNYVIIPGISAANIPLPSAGAITNTVTLCAGSTTTLSNATPGGVWSSSATSIATVGSSGVVTGISAGSAVISYTVTNSFGSATTTLAVVVNPAASAGIIAGTEMVIEGSTTLLSSAYAGGTWMSSNPCIATVGSTGTVTGIAAGTATISYWVSSVCGTAVATRAVTVFVPLTIGGSYAGGKIAYILQPTDSGYVAGQTKGLIAAPSDQSSGIIWGCYGQLLGIPYFTQTGVSNTAVIADSCGTGTAAKLCADLVLGGYSDWYLPNYLELERLYLKRSQIGGFSTGSYWASNESDALLAVRKSFGGGTSDVASKNSSYYVRAVRLFSYPEAITGSTTVCVGATTTLTSATTGGAWSSGNTSVATVNSSGVVLGVSAGTTIISYTAIGTFAASTVTRIVTVNPLPSAGTITGTATLTAGTTTAFSNIVTGGVWSTSAPSIATVGTTGIVIGVAAGTANISYTVTNGCGSASAISLVSVNAAPSLAIGASYGGGIIAYLYVPGDSGYVAGETHGLIAASSDQSTGAQWGCYGTSVSGTSTALGTGAANTAIVSAACGVGTAARLCADLDIAGFSDWYLPSRDELEKLYINRASIGGFATGFYWTSSEANATNAWFIFFNDGGTSNYIKNSTFYVRAVRSF